MDRPRGITPGQSIVLIDAGMKVGVVDIGTNTVLLLVAGVDSRGALSALRHEQRLPRLGAGVDAHGSLNPDAMERVVAILEEYRSIITGYNPATTVVCATSAVREAANRDTFAALVRDRTGFQLEVLGGDDEAIWTYRGAVSGLRDAHRATVVDIGGGSTEITCGNAFTPSEKVSLPIGSVRLTERCFKHDPPTAPEISDAVSAIRHEMSRTKHFPLAGSTLVGVAGTATTLALLDQRKSEFSVEAVSNYRLTRAAVGRLFERLSGAPSREILRFSTVMAGRHDIITAGALILRELMDCLGFDEITVSERGVRYGLAIREWEKRKGTETRV